MNGSQKEPALSVPQGPASSFEPSSGGDSDEERSYSGLLGHSQHLSYECQGLFIQLDLQAH